MKSTTTLEDLRHRYFADLRANNRSEKTIGHYNDSFLDLFKFLDARGLPHTLDAITTEVCRDYVAWLKETPTKLWRGKTQRSIYGVAGRLRDLRVFINWLERVEGQPRRVVVPTVKTTSQEFPVLSNEDLQCIMGTPHLDIHGGDQTVRNRAVIMVLIDCGLRLAEIVSLTPEGIDWEAKMLRVIGKGNKARRLPFSDLSLPYLTAWARIRDHQNPRFFELKYGGMRQLLRRIKEESGVDFWTHRFRHTAASRLIDNGVDLAHVQFIMGHRHVATTMLYVHPDEAAVRKKHNSSSPLKDLVLPGAKSKRQPRSIH